MRRHGWLSTHPMVLHEGKILDGRNRGVAADELGVVPVFREWNGECGTPRLFIFATNVLRRHLSEAARIRFARMFEPDVAAEMESKKADAGRANASKGGRAKADRANDHAVPSGPSGPKGTTASNGQTAAGTVAKMAGISTRTYERGKRVATEAPELTIVRAGCRRSCG